jgi:hypothetical protein
MDVAVDEHRDLAGAGQLAEPRLEIRRVERDHGFVEGDAGGP